MVVTTATAPMTFLLRAALVSFALLFGSGALACEKHIHGHQTSSDTNAEATSR